MENNLPPGGPPGGQLPPVLPPPPVPRPARRRNGWKTATFVLAALLGVVGLGLLWQIALEQLVGGGFDRAGGPRLKEVTLESKRSEHKIAVVPVEGLITSFDGSHDLVQVVKAQLKAAGKDSRVKAVVLKVNSPGGEVLAADQISQAISSFQKESGKPVVASMGSLAASGGYYVSVPCRWIVAHEVSLTGSIGVILQTINFRGLMDKIGLRPETYKSGRFKDMLSGTRQESEIPEEERAMVQKLVNETFERFKRVVGEGRQQANRANREAGDPGRPLDAKWADYADGRVLSGKEAFELGFVDELGDFETAVARARKLAGISEASLVEYQPVFDLMSFLRLLSRSEAGRVRVEVGLELPKLKPGYLYYLPPTYVQ